MNKQRAHLALADGTIFEGFAWGSPGTATGEVVFTTGMTGYQEVLTDPSFTGQIVTMTAPQIGNTGTNLDDPESVDGKPKVSGFIVRDPSPLSSNYRSTTELQAYLEEHGIVSSPAPWTYTTNVRLSGFVSIAVIDAPSGKPMNAAIVSYGMPTAPRLAIMRSPV